MALYKFPMTIISTIYSYIINEFKYLVEFSFDDDMTASGCWSVNTYMTDRWECINCLTFAEGA